MKVVPMKPKIDSQMDAMKIMLLFIASRRSFRFATTTTLWMAMVPKQAKLTVSGNQA